MKLLILSYFDLLIGPKMLLQAPESSETEGDLDQITTLMDLYEEGFFVHMFGSFKSANLIFKIPSEYARGHMDVLLITIVTDINSTINFELARELLEGFAKELEIIPDAYKALYLESGQYEGGLEEFKKVKELFFSFYETFPKEKIILTRKDAKILVFGLYKAGKTTIINFLKKTINRRPLPTTNMDISRILINNLSLFIYDTPGQLKFQNLWKPYLKNQDGLVFVLDITDRTNFERARETLHRVISEPGMEKIPLLILYNKMDLAEPDIPQLSEEMKVKAILDRPLKNLASCALTGENLDDAFNWLTSVIAKRIFPIPKRELGVIFSAWDEEIGAQIIGVHPLDAFEDPELIAMRCFSLTQFIFGGEKFKRISVLLPFTHINVKAAIYFDYVQDAKVRGGKAPLCLIIFYDDKTPRVIIDHFNNYIFKHFAKIKEDPLDKKHVSIELKKIHEYIANKLDSLKDTLEALRIAELRYQALFKAARDAILIFDRKSGIIVDANEQAEKLLQLPREDIIGLHASQINIENNVELMERILLQIEFETSPPIELGIRLGNDEIIPVEINTNEIQMGGQNLIQCILRDISERNYAEKKLKESEKKYKNLFKNAPYAIFLIDQTGAVVDSNPATEFILGYNKYEVIGKYFDKLSILKPKYGLLLQQTLRNISKGDSLTFLDIKMQKKDGNPLWANLTASLIYVEKSHYLQVIINNITEQKFAVEQLKDALIKLKESEEMFHNAYDRANFYKELFINDMVAFFQNIDNSVEDLAKSNADSTQFTYIIKNIRKNAKEGTYVIKNVQKISDIEESRVILSIIHLHDVLENSINIIKDIISDKNVLIDIEAQDSEYHVYADEYLIDVFLNILLSSIKYNEQKEVKITIKIETAKKKNISYCKLEFIDNQTEISDIKKDKLLSLDDSREGKSKGLLLGFLLVERILSSYNGEIWVEGNNFIILIPEAN